MIEGRLNGYRTSLTSISITRLASALRTPVAGYSARWTTSA